MADLDFLAGGGEMGQRMRDHDWAGSALGVPAQWPQALRTAVRLMLNTGHPVYIFWGPSSVCLYNDAYRPSIGPELHPSSLGRPARKVWAEIWHVIGPQIEQVLAGGPASWHENQPIPMTRNGRREEIYWTYSYGPIDDESADAGIGGVLVLCTETTEQVLTARRAIEERERFADLFQQAPTFMVVLRGPDHRVELSNAGYRQLIGHQDIVGRTIAEILPEAVEQGYLDLLNQAYESGRPYTATAARFTVQALRGDAADERYLDFVYQPIKDAAGSVNGIFVEGVDVTERRRAELRSAALARLTDEIRDLDDPDDIAYAAARILGQTLGVSRAGYGDVDMAAETITVKRDWNAPGIKTIAGVLAFREYGSYIDDLKRGETVIFADARTDSRTLATADALTAISARAAVNMPVSESGGLVALLYLNHAEAREWPADDLALIHEVAERTRTATERIRVESALHALNETLEQKVTERTRELDKLWELSVDLLVIADYEGRLLRVSPSWTREFGKSEAALLSEGYWDLVHPDDRAFVVERLAVMRDSDQPVSFESRILGGDDSYRTISWTLSPEPGGARLNGVGRNVTDEIARKAELARIESALRQAQKMEAVGQLTGGLAHDFNNLLTGITGSLEMMQTRMAQGRLVGIERYIDVAQGAARRAAALTQRLLAFSRRQTLDPKVIDVNRLVSGMEDLIRRTIGPSIELEVVGAGGLWATLVDPSQLENALLNLCINARDAMPDGGRLTVETANKWLDESAASGRDLTPGQYISLCVTDTGTGMTPEVMARAFDPFFTTKPIGEGTGLGLSMIYGFAQQSGGQVRIYSEIGTGTTMCLYLPRNQEAPADAEIPNAEAGDDSLGSGMVLIVDDEPAIRMLVGELLEEIGYATLEAADGPAGLRILQTDVKIDLLITDVGLPGGINGRQLADAGRTIRPGLKILFITGYAENAVVGNGHLEPGMQVLTKPFSIDTLVRRVREIMEK